MLVETKGEQTLERRERQWVAISFLPRGTLHSAWLCRVAGHQASYMQYYWFERLRLPGQLASESGDLGKKGMRELKEGQPPSL